MFGERASPVSFAGPKRFHATPVPLAELPELDAVVLSHDHYDHLCESTMRALAAWQVPIVTSLGVGAHLECFGIAPERIFELDWWEKKRIRGVELMAAPARHFSGRALSGRNRTFWSSWVIESEKHRVFFSGDTGLTPEFADIRAKAGAFDLTLLEVGAFDEAWGDIHLGPDHAIEAFEMLGGGTLLPVHWGTFDLGLHAWDAPALTLEEHAARGHRIVMPRLGAPFEPAHDFTLNPWWRG